jgi:hypothetical protein
MVPTGLRNVLLDEGHQCWSAAQAGLAASPDDALSVYADNKHAALVTFDRW